ncbi:MAG: hypothetical protein JW871_07850, partial [Endomicrobiales bacterium]|nr:hypothetical protein [Endomicrobiales bacterium]
MINKSKILPIIFGILFFTSVDATAVGTLIPISSATYNDGMGYGIAVDSLDNIIIAGKRWNGTNHDYCTIKYNSDLTQVLAVATYDGGNTDQANAVAIDSSDNIIVTGYSDNGSNNDYFTIKYDNNLVVLSSVTFDSGGDDTAEAIAIDTKDNIVVTGQNYIVKYDNYLNLITSKSYNAAVGVATDSQDNIITIKNNQYYVIKRSSAIEELSSAFYSYYYNDGVYKTLNNEGYGFDIATDSQDNTIAIGYVIMDYYICSGPDMGPGGITSLLIFKYDTNLVVISSVAPVLPDLERPDIYKGHSIAVDGSDNIIVTGMKNCTGNTYIVVKCNPNLVVLSSANYTASADDTANAVATDSEGNIIVTGYRKDGSDNDIYTVKYLGVPPAITSVSLSSVIQGESYNLIITGENFYNGLQITCSGTGVSASSITVNSTSQVAAVLSVSSGAALGLRDITVTNIDEQSGTKSNTVEIIGVETNAVTPSAGRIGDTIDITISGKNFISTPTATFSGEGINVNSVIYVSSTTLTANITISTSAAAGVWDIIITNPSGA